MTDETPLTWQLVPERAPTRHPEEEAERRKRAQDDAYWRAQAPAWEAALPRLEAEVREREAAVDAAEARRVAAERVVIRAYNRATEGQAMGQDERPVIWKDDPRVAPERAREKQAEQLLQFAQAEAGEARRRRDACHARVCWARSTVPATAP